jgi:hypothetical protein
MPFVSSIRGNFGLSRRRFPTFNVSTTNATITGGSITTAGGYRIHTFTTVGNDNFTVTPNESRNGTTFNLPLEILVVGGGGAGANRHGGGGGAGGMIVGTNIPGRSGASPITVGAGGTSPSGQADIISSVQKGGNSTFDTNVIALGGGGGGNWTDNNSTVTTGGSGGGGSSFDGAPGGVAQQPASSTYSGVTLSGFGFNGGNCRYTSAINAGGGGGAGAAGGSGTGGVRGDGGSGRQNSILGTNYFWAGGGGGGVWENAAGGNGGAGGGGGSVGSGQASGTGGTGGLNNGGTPTNYPQNSTSTVGGNGGANTGSGGGGTNQTPSQGGNGGSGIVVVRYIP